MLQAKVKIISNKEISQKYFKIRLEASRIAKKALPGQFVMTRISDDYEPLLRRPFSIHRVIGKNIEILYEIKGKGTEILSQKKAGGFLDVIGPLGRGFDCHSPFTIHHSPILVAGGMGVAPLTFLAEKLAELKRPMLQHGCPDEKLKVLVLLGAKTKSQISCVKEFENLGCKVKIATDDGSSGFKGRVTDLLKQSLSTINYRLSTIYACGPKPMLSEIIRISKQYNIPAQVSLEEYMACGIGACLGCAVKTKSGYQRVCKEGPVFDSGDLPESMI